MQLSQIDSFADFFNIYLQRFLKTLPYIAIIAVALPIFFYNILSLNPLPDLDYWGMVAFDDKGVSFDPYYLLWVRQNEHLVFLPKLIFAINVAIGHGSNVNLAIFGWFTTVLSALILFRLLPLHLRQPPLIGSLLGVFLAAFLFNPTIAEYWLQGQTIATTATYVIFFSTFMCFYQFYLTQRCLWFNMTIGCAIVLGISGSAWLPLWVSLWFGAVAWRLDKRYLLILLVIGLANYVYYVVGYTKPGGHPPMQLSSGVIADFYITLLGAVFLPHPIAKVPAQVIGGLGVIASIGMIGLSLRAPKVIRDQTLPWIMILLWALMVTGMGAVGRSGFGIEQAFAARYGLFTGIVWMSFGVLVIIYFSHKANPWYYLRIPTLLAVLVVCRILIVGWYHPEYQVFRQREQLKPLATISLITGVYDYNLLSTAVTSAPLALLRQIEILKKYGHYPFAGKLFESCPTMGSSLNGQPVTPAVLGHFDNLIVRADLSSAKVRGWAYSANGAVTCIAVVNQNQIVRGLAVMGFERPDVATQLAVPFGSLGWEGYTHLLQEEKLSAYAKVGEQWYLLRNTHP